MAWRIRYFEEDRFLSLVSEPPSPPLLKTRVTLRTKAHVKPAVSIAPAVIETRCQTDDARDGGDHYTQEQAATRALLDVMEAEIEEAYVARESQIPEPSDELDAGVSAAIYDEIERRTEMTDDPDDRFIVSSDVDLYREAQELADKNGFPKMFNEIREISKAVTQFTRDTAT